MSDFREAIEARVGSIEGYIDATEQLSTYYGPNSLACHGLKILNDKKAEAYFIVPDNLCGHNARPPMFDSLDFTGDGTETVTEEADAREHFVDTLVIDGLHLQPIPGHNIAGLIAEAMIQRFNRFMLDPKDLMLTGLGYIRFKKFIVPYQRILLAGSGDIDDNSIVFSGDVLVGEHKRCLASKFRAEIVDPIDQATKMRMLDTHWLLETTAQGFGLAAAMLQGIDIRKRAPVLLQVEKSSYEKNPIVSGDLIKTKFDILSTTTDGLGLGNSEIFVNGQTYGIQKRLMGMFMPIEKIAEEIKIAKNT